MKRLLALSLFVPVLLLASCKGLRGKHDSMPQKVAYVSFTAENATHWLGGKTFAAAGAHAQAAPVTYHMVMKDEAWHLEESCVRPAAGLFYYNDYGIISAAEAQGILSSTAGVVTRNRSLAEPSATAGSSGRRLYTLAVDANDTGKGQVRYYESNRANDRAFRNLLLTFRNTARQHGSVLPLGGKLAGAEQGK